MRISPYHTNTFPSVAPLQAETDGFDSLQGGTVNRATSTPLLLGKGEKREGEMDTATVMSAIPPLPGNEPHSAHSQCSKQWQEMQRPPLGEMHMRGLSHDTPGGWHPETAKGLAQPKGFYSSTWRYDVWENAELGLIQIHTGLAKHLYLQTTFIAPVGSNTNLTQLTANWELEINYACSA